ncbi:MAG: exonuclease SbcCD subunit D [Desulfomonile tiedjei]|uniref:Nuclease SbcCD subunit D n=1 Tax=Desulfomonile tiedjei TaxID=2358 RepID=A0A9D6UZP5_9BACT|nr:exonuclease SbcCD subunit D [Desulfomonile tiedjei]
MRFIHTADWHLGRRMHGQRLLEDQAYALEQLEALARDFKPDAFLISGDVYDRAVPAPDAVELLNEFLSYLVMDLKVHVIMIAGNHDSPARLDFGSRVFAGQGLHVFGSVLSEAVSVKLCDASGPIHFYGIPYAEPAIVKEKLACEEIHGHEPALIAMLDGIRARHPAGERSVLLAHAYVSGCASAESERPLSVGGAECVDASIFSGFNYVALGHLHRAQVAGNSRIRYAGSLLKYSFSEADHKKVVNLVEIDGSGDSLVQDVSITFRRDVRKIEGFLKDILNGSGSGENREDYLAVSLLDTVPILDVMGKLREIYPNVLHVERPYLDAGGGAGRAPEDHRTLSDADLFAAFFREVTGEELSPAHAEAYNLIVDDLRRLEREATV